MSKIPSHGWKDVVRVLEAEGFKFDRQKGDYLVYTKPGIARPAVVPRKNDLDINIIQSIRKTIGISRNRYIQLLSKGQTKSERPEAQAASEEKEFLSPESDTDKKLS